MQTSFPEIPVATEIIAQWAHVDWFLAIAYIFARFVRVESKAAVQKAQESSDAGKNEHVGVKSEPGEVQPDFNSKIFFDVVQRLIVQTFPDASPLGV